MITLTEAAARHIRKVLADDDASFFKIGLSQKGCSGFAYVMSAEKLVGDECVVYDCGGVKIAVPLASEERLSGVEVDWVRDGLSSRLKVDNPKVSNACGCGSSFMFK
jgi:iron-sulfur cluster assembly protein